MMISMQFEYYLHSKANQEMIEHYRQKVLFLAWPFIFIIDAMNPKANATREAEEVTIFVYAFALTARATTKCRSARFSLELARTQDDQMGHLACQYPWLLRTQREHLQRPAVRNH
jgi:hypothetical protein